MSNNTEHVVVGVDGAELFCETRGDGAPLALLHGFTGAGTNWQLVFDSPPAGYQLVIPDLRGHGRSTNPAGVFTHRQAALDTFAVLDGLKIDSFRAIGLSAGGNTLLHMATQQPDRVEAMVLGSATPRFPQQAREVMSRVNANERSEAEWNQMRQWHQRGDEQIRALWAQSRAFKDSYDDMNFTPPLLSTITARTLIVYGDRDPLYPLEMALELYNAIPHSTLWVIPRAGHNPAFGEFRADFVKTSLAFLADNS